MPERNGPSRARSVAPPQQRELSARELADLAAKTAELKLEAAKRTKEAYAKEREREKAEKEKSDREKAETEKADAETAQANGASSSGIRRGHDFTNLLEGISEDKMFKQVVFLCLARLYAVFCPTEVADIQTRITEQTGQWKDLLEKESNRFLSQVDAEYLVSHLLNEAWYPQ